MILSTFEYTLIFACVLGMQTILILPLESLLLGDFD